LSFVQELLIKNIIGKDRNIKTINKVLVVFSIIFSITGILAMIGGKVFVVLFQSFNLFYLFMLVPLTLNLSKILKSDTSNETHLKNAKFTLAAVFCLLALSIGNIILFLFPIIT
jgi:hypothetical protein